LRVLIDALGIQRPGGGRTATLNLLQGLATLDSGDEWVVLLSGREPTLENARRLRQVVLPLASRLAARVGAEVVLPALAARSRADLIHHSKNLMTLASPCPRVTTLYDLTILARPDLYPALDVTYWRHVEPWLLRRASRVIAISETTARDLEAHYGIGTPQVCVVYPGIDPVFTPVGGPDTETLRRYGLEPGYALHVGSISRKKNLLPLVKAVESLNSRHQHLKLALVGRVYDKSYDGALFEYIRSRGLESVVRLTGPVPQVDLPDLYRGAGVFVFPSVHEGFGLVPVEAMACGVPVVSSAGGALREVLGGAALMLPDASDAAALAEAIRIAASDGPERRGLIQRGFERARRYSREESVCQTVAIYRSLARR